ncbi:BRI1 kinase inhibitor 1-like [Salvia miltiorrhiza]|uniref:BRI1 kinase inhibitor 1-like n=1 Tax=Salvia miltiorrhiza TaxID=226208 RepID=UPI0025AC9321|nr:BRI1 kinase inhibitor 1-like [Salvia miltiorrhiza]
MKICNLVFNSPFFTKKPAQHPSISITAVHAYLEIYAGLSTRRTTNKAPHLANEIFFHGHLLPLHLLSHLHASPRSSTNSLDSFTLPIKELLSVDENNRYNDEDDKNNIINGGESRHVSEGKGKGKSKSLSLFVMPKWRKEREEDGDHEHSTTTQKQQKSRFELLKRYVRFVKPFLSLRRREQGSSIEFLRQ